MRAPQRLVVQLEHEIVGRVLHHADLLEDHLSLECEISLPQRGPEDDVANDVGGLAQMLIEHTRLVDSVLARRIRVERAAECLEGERDLVRASRLGPLENHVLEKVRYAHAVARLVKRRGANPRTKGNRPHSRHVLREYGQSIG